MLKKRILASSMASVMALSAVSVVAFADETVTAGATESVDKATLKEYIAGFESFLKTDVYEYGTIQADQIQNAVDYAENVIADANATDDDATAAYQMVKSVYDSLEKFDADDLKELMADVKDIYDSENILNEDLNDLIYPQDKFDDFVDAYEDADSYVNSGDGRLITDSYIALEKAAGDLEALPSVTKKDFRAVLKEYEAIATKAADYESWRRGTVTVNPETGDNFKANNAKKVKLADAYYVTNGALYDIVYGDSLVTLTKNEKGEVLNTTAQTWIATGIYGTVKDFVEAKYEEFDKIQTSTKTTDEDIALAYNAAKEAVEVFKSWKADDTTRAAKANINNLIDKYRAKLVRDFGTNQGGIVAKIQAAAIAGLPAYTAGKTEWKTEAKTSLILDKETHLIALDDDGNVVTTADETKHYVQTVAKNQDIMKYIPVLTANVATTKANQTAYNIANKYYTDAYAFEAKLVEYKAAKAALGAATTPTGTEVTTDTGIVLAGITNPVDGTTGSGDVAGETITPYKYTDNTEADKVEAVKAYNKLVAAQKDAYDALATLATKLTASQTAAGVAANCPVDYKNAAEALLKQRVKYEAAVADIKAFKALTEPTVGVVGTTTNSIWEDTTVAVVETKDIDGNVLLAAGNIKKYKAGTTSGGAASASNTDPLVKDWNDAVAKAGTAAGVLTTDATDGSVKKYGNAKKAFAALNEGVDANAAADLVAILTVVDNYNAADKVQDDTSTEPVDERAVAFAAAYDGYLAGLDENDIVEKAAGSRNEYTLINRKLTYVLEDMYPATKTDKYTKNDVKNLIEKAYDLCDKTGDSEVFSERHLVVVEARKDALDWLTAANATKGYKEGDKVDGLTATDAYKALKNVYDKLEKDYKAMPMSYGEIAELIATTAKAIDAGEYGSSADAVKVALSAVAAGLSTLEASLDENYVFDYDREFVAFNRLLVGETADKKKPNDDEKELKKSIDTLNAAIEAAKAEPEKPEVVLGDADGDGILSPADATKALDLFLNDEYLAAADMDSNGIINAADAYAILDAWLQA